MSADALTDYAVAAVVVVGMVAFWLFAFAGSQRGGRP